MKNMAGQKFGRLTAIERHGSDKKGNIMWLCKCECGGTSIVRGTHLRDGGTKTCGGKGRSCRRRERLDITGKVFTRLTAIRPNGAVFYGEQKIQKWECRCVCGNMRTVPRSALISGVTKSCGCLNHEIRSKASTRHGRSGTPEYRLFHHAKGRAKKHGFPFNLELDDIVIPKVCPLLGTPLAKSKRTISCTSPTVDRMDPKAGYVKGNVWVISQKANQMKSDLSLAAMKHFVAALEEAMQPRPGT